MENEWSDIRDQTTWGPERFTSLVYQQVMSGKPRMSGALAALEPEACFVVEDAVSGVQAAGAGGMVAALGLARAGDADMLAAAGADLVVESLDEVDVECLRDRHLVRRRE